MIEGPLRMGPGTEQKIQRFLPIACDEDVVRQTFRAQGMQRKFHVLLTIIDQKDIDFIFIHT
jgi:hypothetical protein